jgi:hypothetical protein
LPEVCLAGVGVSGPGLDLTAEVGGEDVEFGAVFGDGAAREGNAAFAQDFDDFLVGERFVGVFAGDEVLDGVFDAGVGHDFACRCLVAGGEEEFKVEEAVGGLDVFVGDGAADGGFVDADDFGDLIHGEGLEVGDAVVKEVALALYNFGGDVVDGLLALVEALDEEFSGADFFFEVFFEFGVVAVVGEEVFVGVADAQAGNGFVVHDDDPVVTVFLDAEFGLDDVLFVVGAEAGAGTGLKGGDELGGLLDAVEGDFEGAGDFLVFFAAEFGEVVGDDFGFDFFAFAEAAELNEETFAQVAGGDADGVKGLDEVEGFLGRGVGNLGGLGDFFEGDGEVAGVVEVADDFVPGALELDVVGRKGELLAEVVGEVGGFDLGVEEELAAFGGFGAVAGGGVVLGVVVAPVFVVAAEFFEFAIPFGVVGRGFLGGCLGFFAVVFLAVVEVVGGEVGFVVGRFDFVGNFFEDGVDFDFLLDKRLKFKRGRLQELQRLLHLRGQGLSHREILM